MGFTADRKKRKRLLSKKSAVVAFRKKMCREKSATQGAVGGFKNNQGRKT